MSYNCGGVKNTYRDFKEVEIWTDAPLSCEKYRSPPKKQAPRTPSPRTSSPIPDILINDNIPEPEEARNAYTAWKDHLHETPTKMKVRGATFQSDEFISGHLIMKEHEKREYHNKENQLMPALNKCFVNLLINGPTPLVCRIHGNHGHRNYLSKCHCLPSCNCEQDMVKNSHLPIGYRHNEHGLVVPMVSAVCDVKYRDPMCIYTN